MAVISALMYQSKFAASAHPVLAIDGVSFDVWLSSQLNYPDLRDLVPAQGWLLEDQDLEIAWRRLTSQETNFSTVVPLLICPDDLDFDCTVVVAEQEITVDEVIWKRFGLSVESWGEQVGSSVKWFEPNVSAKFNRSQFQQAVMEFERLIDGN